MREFDLDLLISKEVAVNCKTKAEEIEFLTYLQKIGIKWCSGCAIFENEEYQFEQYRQNTCFTFYDSKSLVYDDLNYYISKGYKILSLDDLVIKPKNNFKDYGFEADFEGEILKEVDGIYLGYIIDNGFLEMLKIYKDGSACRNGTKGKFNLKPIKKEWYENPDNVGKLIVYDYFNDNRIGIFKCLHKDKGWIELYALNGCKVDRKTHKVRPATKEEVLSLLVKE